MSDRTGPPENEDCSSMEVAASLSPQDPIRQKWEEEAFRQGAAVTQQWLEELRTTDRIRFEMRAVSQPHSMHERLLAIGSDRHRPRGWGWRPLGAVLVTVAALVLFLGLVWGIRAHRHRRHLSWHPVSIVARHECSIPWPAVTG